MTTKSPTTSVRSHEIIGVDKFSQRREVFDKHDTVFLPLPSPTTLVPVYKEVEPIITSNHGKTTTNFKRNTPGYSSMRETSDREIEFRPRKYSDNFTSELNQSDDVDYRYTMMERTRRLSKLRRDFLNSNLHDPSESLSRNRTRASLPATSITKYKIESPNLYKFPFPEPYATPPPVRRVVVDLGPSDAESGKENQDPEAKPNTPKHYHSLPNSESPNKVDHQKLFEQLVKRYSPQRKPVDWNLPPTRPKVVGSVPKSFSSVSEVDNAEKIRKSIDNINKAEDDDVFIRNEKKELEKETEPVELKIVDEPKQELEKLVNGPQIVIEEADKLKTEDAKKESQSKTSLTELEEKNDRVPELATIQRQISRESAKKTPIEKYTDITIPALIEKMTVEGDEMEKTKESKKVKRKRSFLDKLLGRKKNK